jgi:hypothetical protein
MEGIDSEKDVGGPFVVIYCGVWEWNWRELGDTEFTLTLQPLRLGRSKELV